MKNDKQMLDMLRNEFEKSSESVKVPLKLQKESMVAMLKNEGEKSEDFSVKTGTNKTKHTQIFKITAAAAMITLVVAGAMSMRQDGGVEVIKKDSFYSGYEDAERIRIAQDYEELIDTAKVIIESAKPSTPEKEEKNTAQNVGTSAVSESKETADKLYEGYQCVVSEEIVASEETEMFMDANVASSDTDVVPVKNDINADIVKSNGNYLYIVTTGRNPETGSMTEYIKIVRSVPPEEMKTVSTVTISDNAVAGASEVCEEIYVKDNVMIAILGKKDFATEPETTAVYYDISNPEMPEKIREHNQDGKYLFSSLNGNSLCLVTDKQVTTTDEELVPEYSINGETTVLNAEDIFITVKSPEASFVFITVTDFSDFEKSVGHLAIFGSGKQFYCSENAITAAREFVSVEADENGMHPSFTEVYRFDINGNSIVYVDSYVLEGSLISGISVDSENGYLTAATTVAGTKDSAESNNIIVLDAEMEFVSGLRQIFPNKKVDAVKFIGKNGYISSGEETMIIDLSSPKKPKVAGTIPTKLFTGTIYEISESKLLGINIKEDKTVIFRLFDVSDPENPSVAAEYVLANDYTLVKSADTRGVMVVSDKEMFGVPVVIRDSEKGTESSAYIIFEVAEGKINFVGTCSHNDSYVADAAVRAAYNDGTVYTVSGEKIVAFSADDCKEISYCEIR